MYTPEEKNIVNTYFNIKNELSFYYFKRKTCVLSIFILVIFLCAGYTHISTPFSELKNWIIFSFFSLAVMMFFHIIINERDFKTYKDITLKAIEITSRSKKLDIFLKKEINNKMKKYTSNTLPDFSRIFITCKIHTGDTPLQIGGSEYPEKETFIWEIPLTELPVLIMKKEIERIDIP